MSAPVPPAGVDAGASNPPGGYIGSDRSGNDDSGDLRAELARVMDPVAFDKCAVPRNLGQSWDQTARRRLALDHADRALKAGYRRVTEDAMTEQLVDSGNLQDHARRIVARIRDAGFDPATDLLRQVLTVAEEAGEFVGAFRRWNGMARRSGTREEMLDELADVLITSLVMCERLGEDIGVVIGHKLTGVYARGWREPAVGGGGL